MTKLRPLGLLAVATALAVTPANAYYYFVHYLSTGNAPEKFDLTVLPQSTLTFLVSEVGPTSYTATDTFNSVLAQIQQATQIWNGVASSSLRVAFGGLESFATPQNTAGGDVLFEDLPPGVEGFGGPTSLAANPVKATDGTWFFPITRSVVHLSLDLTQAPGPSYNQSFLMTTLHEMGHAMGLQHTFTSATMSQNTTRATTLVHALSADDVAGLSSLYPNPGFKQFGSITGQVTAGGKGVHLASVVAISPGADAVSAVTNPDGTYLIQGLPPGDYAVYVHTMPPDADVFGPYDINGNAVAASDPVNSLFYPGTTAFNLAGTIAVAAGTTVNGVNIVTTTRPNVPYYDGQVYGYLNNNTIPVTPGPVAISTGVTPVVASVVGLGSNGQAPGLGVQIPGGAVSIVPKGIVPLLYDGYTYIDLYFAFSAAAQPGLQHMIFTTPDYMYVLPSAMYLTATGPPVVTGAAPNLNGTVTVTGTSLSSTSLIYFDSLPATILSVDPVAGAVVIPPSGASGQQATVTIYNTDGQNSQMIPGGTVTYPYGNSSAPSIAISPLSLPAGSDSMIDIVGNGISFVPGQTVVGFGTSDVLVQHVYVLSPNHVQVDVAIPASAALSISDVSVMSGFQLATLPGGFQITAPVANLPAPFPDLVNAYTGAGITGAYPGAVVTLYGSNLGVTGGGTTAVNIGGYAAVVLYASPNQVNLQIPAGLSPGPALLTLYNGQNTAPVDVNIDPPPSGFAGVQSAATGAYIDTTNPAYQGETLIATMVNFAPAGANIALSQVQVAVGGVMHPALNVVNYGSIWQVTFQIGVNDPTGASENLIVYLNGLSSLPAGIEVLPGPAGSRH